jgi:hypothetical protein
MLKKAFIGVLFVALLSTVLIAGVDFNVTKAEDYSSSGTPVGGIIWENTTWTLENSPYIITDTVQIPENVTLTIEPGVTVISQGGTMFLIHGRIYARGTINNKITFDGASRFFDVDGSSRDTFLDLDYCIIKNGGSFWWDGYGHFNLTRSELINLASYSYIWYPGKDVHIEYNTFINSAGFSVGHDGPSVYIRYNLIKGNRGFVVENWVSYAGQTIVKYNSFIDMSGIVLKLPPGYDRAAMTATENYWGTQDTDVIDQMIYDRNDDIMCPSFIEYLPILTEPHPETPIMLEDVNVGINGVFRRDGDGKWRCYANITIRNNSYRNVTISWIFLNAINITYIDETFEELNISGNETLNYVIQPEQELSVNWTITTFGFTKEPKILWVLFKTSISEAYGTITLTTVIPEFPSFLITPLFMIATLLAVIVYRRKRIDSR